MTDDAEPDDGPAADSAVLPTAEDIWRSIRGVRERAPLGDLYRRDLEQDIGLKKQYASNIARLLVGQVVVTNVVFVIYAAAGMHWRVPQNVMIAWLSSTVVELVGIATVVTRSLFPRREATGVVRVGG